jgi:hypothetical protein
MTLSPASSVRGGFPLGLTGATAATRYVGATASGAPAAGTFAVGDFCVDQSGSFFVCTVAGSPGTWVEVGAGGGGDTVIEEQVLGSAGTFDFTGIAATFRHLRVVWTVRATNAGGVTVNATFNADAGANYFSSYIEGASGVAQSTQNATAFCVIGGATGSGDTAGRAGHGTLWLPYYAQTTFHKNFEALSGRSAGGGAGNQVNSVHSGTWADIAAVSRITIVPSAGATFVTGSRAVLYGVA